MSAVRLSARSLAELSASSPSEIERMLANHLVTHGAGAPSTSERRSWQNSLPVLARDLADAGLGNVEVLLQHQLPLSSKRTNALLAGFHPVTGDPQYAVVELKQWNAASTWPDAADLVEVPNAPYSPVLHPSIQVDRYVQYLQDFVGTFAAHNDAITGIAYLHNATDESVATLWDNDAVERRRLFTGQRRGAFQDHLRALFSDTPGVDAADALLGSAIAPSKQLLTVAAAEVQRREQFVLLDEQQVAYEIVLRAVEKARRANTKTVAVITGGPGSGKSVIALSLLGELARQGRPVMHATGSRSFTQTLRKVAGARSKRTQDLFKYFNSFMEAEANGLEVLISDEAHRIRDVSVNRYTPKALRERARPQIEELLDAARVPVFLLDEHQVVRPGEQGTVADIRAAAAARGVDVVHVNLNAQYRAGGSDAYLQWVLRLFGLESGGPVPWFDEETFTVAVVDSPAVMESTLRTWLDRGKNARMTAGYCWPWSDPVPPAAGAGGAGLSAGATLVPDVRIGDWAKPWNSKSERQIRDVPPSALWASDPGGFEQVGCVYTAQGFEYAWNGVILGGDLVWRTDRWVARRSENRDPDFRSTKVSDAEFDRLVRNVYKVLLTRGMEGTLLYSVDPETQAMLRGLVNPG